MARLPVGTKVVIEGHVTRGTWHLSNGLTGKGQPGTIVDYDVDGDYIVEALIKGKLRRQKVKA